MHHVFIVNPVAGKGRSMHVVEAIESRFKRFPQTYEINFTQAPGHAKELASKAVANNGQVRIYSVGGDGTLNEVINGMAMTNSELGIIPCGSGNDASRMIYPVTDPYKLISVLPVSSSATFDLGKANDRYFFNIASIGFDAEVVLKSQYFKSFVSGSMSYILGVLSALMKLDKYKLNISIDDNPGIEKDFLLSIFANGTYYGGGFKAAPGAKMDDGILDCYLVDAISRLKILRFLPKFRKGDHGDMDEVNIVMGKKAIITSNHPFPINIDGEVSIENNLSIELLPKAIKIIVP